MLEKASAPYFEILELWIYRGKIHDIYGEFLVEERENLNKDNMIDEFNDTYWDTKYKIRTEQFPTFLNKVADKILTAGKYLNVIRECGKEVALPFTENIRYTQFERE